MEGEESRGSGGHRSKVRDHRKKVRSPILTLELNIKGCTEGEGVRGHGGEGQRSREEGQRSREKGQVISTHLGVVIVVEDVSEDEIQTLPLLVLLALFIEPTLLLDAWGGGEGG